MALTKLVKLHNGQYRLYSGKVSPITKKRAVLGTFPDLDKARKFRDGLIKPSFV